MASVTGALPLPRRVSWFLPAVLAGPLLLGIAHLLPAEGVGLGLRLGAGAICILLLPGALVLRVLGWPASAAVAAAAALSLSLGVVFFALALTFAAGGSLSLTITVIAVFSLAALVTSVGAEPLPSLDGTELRALVGVLLAGAAFAAVVWIFSPTTISGDALFHLARARKLAEFDQLSSVRTVREFADGGLHPGYAFPLWQGVLALVARLASVDVAEVVRHLAAVLVPLSFVASFGAGRALFRSSAAGVATLAGAVAIAGLGRGGIGFYESLALPSTSGRLLIVPAFLAVAFALARGARWSLVCALVAGGVGLTLTHPTYALFLALPLGGFVVLRTAIGPRDRRLAQAYCALPALVVPFFAYTLWILPVLNSTRARGAGDRARAVAHYAGQVDVVGGGIRLAADAIARGGAAVVAAFLAVPLAALAGRRLWSAVVLGGTVSILAVVLVPQLFTPLADAISVSQARRLVLFLPLPFALAGAAILAGRLRLAGVAAALAVGIGLQLAYPAETTYRLGQGGPGWAVWVAFGGGIGAIVLALWRRLDGPEPSGWAALTAVALVIPIAVAGFADLHRDDRPDRYALTPGLVRELRTLERRSVVFSNLETSYRIAAYVPIRIAAAPPAHVARTKLNAPINRRRDVVRFFFTPSLYDYERTKILDHYGVDGIVVDKTRRYPEHYLARFPLVWQDARYALYEVPEAVSVSRLALRRAPAAYDATFIETMADAYLGQTPWTRLRLAAVRDLVEPSEGDRVLDLGCAAGAVTHFLSTFGCDVTGIDAESLAIQTARSLFPSLRFELADVRSLPFADESFDKAVAADLVEHLVDDDFVPMLAETRRVLAPGGTLSLYTPNPRHLIERLKEHNLVLAQNPTHVGLRDEEALRAAVEAAGLAMEVLDWRPSFFRGLRYVERRAGGRMRLLRYRLCLRARKR